MANPIVFNTGSRIGKISAEADDEFLFECFVDVPALIELTEPSSPKMLLLGSTGAGKTALIRKIEKDAESSNFIQLDEMAIDYLANSDVIQFLVSLDVNLDLFFQALWKHVILIEFIRLKFQVTDEKKSKYIFGQILSAFSNDKGKQKGIEYLQKWENKFWISMDENIREITHKLEEDVKAELGAEVQKFKAKAGYMRGLSAEKKIYLQRVARKFAMPELLSDLAKVIDTLAEHSTRMNPSFLLIDRLDENWIDESVKYPLIRALIESLKSLRRITDLKTIVSLRSDLLEKVILETKDDGFQSEKYDDYIVRLKWTPELLKKLINKRMNFLFRRKYNQNNVTFEDVFTEKVTNSGSAFSAILEKSLLRPRDIINLVNMCFEASEGKTSVSRKTFTQAEISYSSNRLTAMIEEWQNVIPNVSSLINLLKGKRASFELAEFCTSKLLDDLVGYYPEKKGKVRDSLWRLVDDATSKEIDPVDLASLLVEKLHLIGAIGVKYDPNLPYQYFYQTQKLLPTNQLNRGTKIRVHPMVHSALGIIK